MKNDRRHDDRRLADIQKLQLLNSHAALNRLGAPKTGTDGMPLDLPGRLEGMSQRTMEVLSLAQKLHDMSTDDKDIQTIAIDICRASLMDPLATPIMGREREPGC